MNDDEFDKNVDVTLLLKSRAIDDGNIHLYKNAEFYTVEENA